MQNVNEDKKLKSAIKKFGMYPASGFAIFETLESLFNRVPSFSFPDLLMTGNQ